MNTWLIGLILRDKALFFYLEIILGFKIIIYVIAILVIIFTFKNLFQMGHILLGSKRAEMFCIINVARAAI